jgi:hypothetical protein
MTEQEALDKIKERIKKLKTIEKELAAKLGIKSFFSEDKKEDDKHD